MSAMSGSMPVVSQSIMKQMVPVGASTLAWALRKPAQSRRIVSSTLHRLRSSDPCTKSKPRSCYVVGCFFITAERACSFSA